MSKLRNALGRLSGEERGVGAVEFALILPVFMVLLLGLFDLCYNVYAASVVQGAIHDSARDSTLEGATAADLDAAVANAVRNVVPNGTVTATRAAYAKMSDMGKPEDFTDVNKDGTCNGNEPFEDANGNGSWDQDRGAQGNGGARDSVMYTVTVVYPRAFPVGSFIGLPSTVTLQTSTVLRNQPFSEQTPIGKTGNCK